MGWWKVIIRKIKITLYKLIKTSWRDCAVIISVFLIASEILYGYYQFYTPVKMDYVFRNWDGPAYVVVAKSFYNVNIIKKVNELGLDPTNYAYKFPLYPFFIRIFSFMGYSQSMIATSQLFSLLFILSFYFLLKNVNPSANALVVSLLLIFYPPRWFIVSHVGSSEPVLLFFLTLFIIFFLQKKYIVSAIFAGLAQMARSQGILFFGGLALYYFYEVFVTHKKRVIGGLKEFLPFILIPLSLVGVFTLLYLQYGNFFAYTKIHTQYHVLQWPPLGIIWNFPLSWLEGLKEAFIFNYLFYLVAIMILFQKKMYSLAIMSLVYYLPLILVFHSDISRYALPLMPMLGIAYSDALSKRAVYLSMFLCLPIIFLFTVSFINSNLASTR